jgi:DNA end-binding protein Ku
VSIPVGVYTAADSSGSGVSLNQLHKNCGQCIRYKKTCPVHGEVQQVDIVSGYEFSKDQYVIVDEAEKRAAMPKNEKAITIAGFIECDCIDPLYFTDRHYYLLPEGPVGAKPYVLLRQAMRESKRNALAQVILSSREHVAVIRPLGDVLSMSLLSYQHELKEVSAIGATCGTAGS